MFCTSLVVLKVPESLNCSISRIPLSFQNSLCLISGLLLLYSLPLKKFLSCSLCFCQFGLFMVKGGYPLVFEVDWCIP